MLPLHQEILASQHQLSVLLSQKEYDIVKVQPIVHTATILIGKARDLLEAHTKLPEPERNTIPKDLLDCVIATGKLTVIFHKVIQRLTDDGYLDPALLAQIK